MERGEGQSVEMVIRDVVVEPMQEGYRPVRLLTSRGTVACRFYRVPGARRGAIWVGSIGGGWDSPAKELYPRLCEELMGEGIASLRVRYRHPTTLDESVLDVLASLGYLESDGVEAVALTGHSFGGAVAIQAAAIVHSVRTVVTLATQNAGARPVSQLSPHCSILLIHGTADRVLPPSASDLVYRLAHEPKRLLLYEGAGHGLDEVAEEVHQVIRDWIVEKLSEILI